MPLDIIPSIPTSQTLRYAKASFDFDRDGGDVGVHSIPSQQVPAGALVLGATWSATTPFTLGEGGSLSVLLATLALFDHDDPLAHPTYGGLGSARGFAPSDGSYPIVVRVDDAALTAGALVVYVWYVL
jgi:hypothetical protein